MSSSPVAVGGYFAPHPPSAMSPNQGTATPMIAGAIVVPTSPMATTNTLTQQLARASIPNQPLVTPRLPTSPMMTTGPIGRSVSAASGRREMSGSSLTADYLSHTPSASLPPTLSIKTQSAAPPGVISSDEEESYFSDPHAAFPGGHAPSPVHTQPSTFDPNKVILSAYLMKRSKGRGRKFWRKRWFYLTSQGLTYTKSHMVCSHPPSAHFPADVVSGLAPTSVHPALLRARRTGVSPLLLPLRIRLRRAWTPNSNSKT